MRPGSCPSVAGRSLRSPRARAGRCGGGLRDQGHAEAGYGVVLSGSPADGTLAVDQTSTEVCRSALAAGGAVPPPNACRFGQGKPPGRPPSANNCFPEAAERVSALPSLLNAPGTFGSAVPALAMRIRVSRHGHGLRGAARPAGRDRRAADRTPGRRADHDRSEKWGLKGSRALSSFQHSIRVPTPGIRSRAAVSAYAPVAERRNAASMRPTPTTHAAPRANVHIIETPPCAGSGFLPLQSAIRNAWTGR